MEPPPGFSALPNLSTAPPGFAEQSQSSTQQNTQNKPRNPERNAAGHSRGNNQNHSKQNKPRNLERNAAGHSRGNNQNHPIQNKPRNSERNAGQFLGNNQNHPNHYKRKKAKDRLDHAGIRMKGPLIDCLICCQKSDLYGIGGCLHPMCMECAIRMRILGQSNACPQCRKEIETLYIVELKSRNLQDLKIPHETVVSCEGAEHGIRFSSEYAIDCFKSYTAHKCYICMHRGSDTTFPVFAALNMHMSHVHQLSSCYICTANINVLTKDRKFYTRKQLLQHMKGDDSNSEGFSGHPKCLFCEERFYDDEMQYRHLRKEHYFCQLCSSDGTNNFFYRTHKDLMRHYEKSHFMCKHIECLDMGIVFRTEQELNIHRSKHLGGRAVQLDMQFSNRGAATSSNGGNANNRDSLNNVQTSAPPRPPENITIVPSAQSRGQPVRIVRSAAAFNPNDFPNLEVPPPGHQAIAPYGAPPNYRSQQQSSQQFPQSQPVSLQSRDQFPTLSNGTSNLSGTSQATVWARGNTKDLFKRVPEQQQAQQKQQRRQRVIPSPDIWPEGMQKLLKAREVGGPEALAAAAEAQQEIQTPANSSILAQEMVEAAKKKDKKKKSKTVPVGSISDRSNYDFVPSSSKFQTLSAYDEGVSDSESASALTKNWWSLKKPPDPRKKKTDPPTKEGASEVGVLTEQFPPINGAISLRSIAMGLESKAGEQKDENLKSNEDAENN